MPIKESDIPPLDFIVDNILKMNCRLYSNTLVEAGLIKETEFMKIETEFEYFLSIIKEYDCAKVNEARNVDNGINVERSEQTAKFWKNGGFASVFKELQNKLNLKRKSEQKEQIELELAKSNLEANELNKKIAKHNSKNEKNNRIYMWINIFIGVLNAILLAWSILKG